MADFLRKRSLSGKSRRFRSNGCAIREAQRIAAVSREIDENDHVSH